MRMTSRAWVAALVILFAAKTAAADDPQYYDGEIVYKSAGILTEYKTAEEACTASAKNLEKNGLHNQFIKTKKGSDDASITCVMKNLDSAKKEQWDQTNNVTKLVKCKEGVSPRSTDNSGKFETIKCPCDPGKGCQKKPINPPVVYGCQTPATHPSCSATTTPPGIEDSPRCKQQPASPMSKQSADRHSDAMKKELTSTAYGRDVKKKYAAALEQIADEKATGAATASNPGVNAFPKFKPDQMCETGGPTDVNIGMPCGSREADFAAANNIAGLANTPHYDGKDGRRSIPNLDCVWHHHEELGRMQLVKRGAHKDEPHTGGVKIWETAMGIPDYPLCCPPPPAGSKPPTKKNK
jgi:hypothetical protein